MHSDSLAVIGLGAIGGSLAWQARRHGVPRVVGYAPERTDVAQALRAGAITEAADSPARAVRDATLVILATPPGPALALLDELAPAISPAALLSDVASIKAPVVARAVAAGLGSRFAGAHPLAGTHGSGFAYARPDRLEGCVVYVTPTGVPGGDAAARGIMSFWERVLGASPVLIDAIEHDRRLAWTSHLPQAVASALAKALADRGLSGVSYGPGGRDTTRLAASSPEMWVDILLLNGGPVAEALMNTEAQLAHLRRLIEAQDASGLREFLASAARFRRGLDG